MHAWAIFELKLVSWPDFSRVVVVESMDVDRHLILRFHKDHFISVFACKCLFRFASFRFDNKSSNFVLPFLLSVKKVLS